MSDTLAEPDRPCPGATLYLGDCLAILPALPDACVDAVITDPPYSSGGMFRGDRNGGTDDKYTLTAFKGARPDFSGDSRDQRSWLYWCALWLSECLRVCKPSGYLLMFSDWRQLPQAADAIQCGGWVWRGIVVWDKTLAARGPHTGYFRHQCEYVPWATAGECRPVDDGRKGMWPACLRYPVIQADKHHQAGKPTPLMRDLLCCVPPGGTVLDPFMGSATTGAACVQNGLGFIGVEKDRAVFEAGRRRLAEAQGPLFATPGGA
jgi:site-specific DNA-methyltransferase (adenine-specific)